MNNSKTNKTLLCLLLLLFVAGVYGQFLWNPLIFDDHPFFMPNDVGVMPLADFHYSLFQIRSLPYATLAWTQAWFGLDLINFRVGNLLLHWTVVAALFLFLQSLFSAVNSKIAGTEKNLGLSPSLAAFFAALLFALHPVATYAAGYLVQRTIVMATLFSLLSMLSYLKGSTQNKPLWLWASVPLYFLAVFSKEHVIMLPSVLVILTVLLHDDWREKLKARVSIFAAHALIAACVFLAMRGLLGSVYEVDASKMLSNTQLAYPLSVLTQSWLFFKYALLWLFPNSTWMSLDMREPFAGSLMSAYLLAVICFIAWGAGGAWLLLKRGRLGLIGFSLLFPWLTFLTEFSTVRIQEVFVLYRSYFWVVGAFCLLPVVFAKVSERIAATVLAVIALAMVPISMERLMVMSQPMFVWDDAVKLVKDRPNLPGVYRIYYNRGIEYQKIGMADRAIADLNQAFELNKEFSPAYGALGAAYLSKNDTQNAVKVFQKALEIERATGKYFQESNGNLGLAYLRNGEFKNAIESFTVEIEDARRNKKAPTLRDVFNRAQAYEKLGDLQKSQADYKLACDLAKKSCDKLK
jgi:protein O-mannosyl-transferase